MKKIIFLLLIQIGLLSSCQQNNETDNPEKFKDVLANYFDGMKTKNYQKMKDFTTGDFILFDDVKFLITRV